MKKFCFLTAYCCALYFAVARAAGADAPQAEILGDWRGTSKCVDLVAAPACKDEVVLYHMLPVAGATGRVLCKADKIIRGVAEPMGDIEFHYRTDTDCWESEIENPRFHAVWSFTVKGRTMTGTLVLLPDHTLVRKVATKKD